MHRAWLPRKGTILMHTRIPAKMNGYDIIAAAPPLRIPNPQNLTGAPCSFMHDEFIVLGQDLSRERPKWVTAYIQVPRTARIYNAHDGWVWGHYFENAAQAAQDFTQRLLYKIDTPACEGCGEIIWSLNRNGYCTLCTSAALRADLADGGSRLESII